MRVENLAPYAQPEVHGLLGQRAIDPKPPVQALVEQPANSDKNELAALATTTLSATLDLGGAAASVTRLCARPVPAISVAQSVSCAALVPAGGVGAGTTVRAAVQADGRAQPLPPGLQGEGFIEGSYLDYKVSSMGHSPLPPRPPHHSRRRLFACGAGQDGLVARARRVQVLALHRVRRRRGVSLRGLAETIGCGMRRRGL